jgi:WS/DGAT/MGAT family acyltransferase
MDRLSALDASFLHVESSTQPMHVGSVMVFEGPAPTFAEFTDFIAARVPLIRRYRQIVRSLPFVEPRWQDYPEFTISDHVRHTALPGPGNEEQLNAVVSRVMFHRLDRRRPLWEMWLVHGLANGRWAVLSKTHHAMIDGVAGSDLMGVLLTPTPEVAEPEPDTWVPEPGLDDMTLWRTAAVERVENTVGWVKDAVRDPRTLGFTAAATVKGLTELIPMLPGQESPFNAPIGRQRAWATARAPLADIKEIRKALGGTVNDVVITAIAGGVRDLLLERGLDPTDVPVRTMVPVSMRGADEHGDLNNRVAACFADLPINEPDPVERLAAVTEQMQHIKGSGQAVAAGSLVGAADYAPAPMVALSGRVLSWAPQSAVQMVTTNVPGPQMPLYLAGRRMLHAYPYVPVGARITTSIGIFSYDGEVAFGINADGDAVPDAEVLARGIDAALDVLLQTARHG